MEYAARIIEEERTSYYSGGKFEFENVMRLQRTKHLCSVNCAYEYDRPFAEFLQTPTFVVHCRANRISPKQKLNMDGRD
jgi:hypothetical protein